MNDDPVESDRGAVSTKPITQRDFGPGPVFSESDLDEIMDSVGIDLLDTVDRNKFRVQLDNSVRRTLILQLRKPLDKQDIKRFRSSLDRFVNVSRGLFDTDFPPPMPPLDWLEQTSIWADAAERKLENRKDGGAPRKAEISDFIPMILGLFFAGFGVAPDAFKRTQRDEKNPAFVFLDQVQKFSKKAIEARGFEKGISPDLVKRARWFIPSDDALRKRFEDARLLQMKSEHWTSEIELQTSTGDWRPVKNAVTDYAWRVHGIRFQMLIQNDEQEKKLDKNSSD